MIREFKEYLTRKDYPSAHKFLEKNSANLSAWECLLYESALLLSKGDTDEAEGKLLIAESLQGRGVEVPLALARFYMHQSNQERARFYAERAYGEQENEDTVLAYLHTLLDISDYRRVLELVERHKNNIKKNVKPFMLAAASAFRASGKPDRAIRIITNLLVKYPNDRTCLRLHADCLADKDSTLGLKKYKEVIEVQKNNLGKFDIATCWNASLHFLRHREFDPGWDYWEMGFGREVGTMARKLPEQIQALTRIPRERSIDKERWIIVVPEQGIGDQILFLSGLASLSVATKRMILVADHRLFQLLKRSFPQVVTTTPGFIDGIGNNRGIDVQGYIPYGSILPRTRPDIESFKANRSVFLKADQATVVKVKTQLAEKRNHKKLIGISWGGGFWETQRRTKGVALEYWVEALRSNSKAATFLCLQYGDTKKEQDLVSRHKAPLVFVDGVDFKKDIETWTALIAACDGIFSVSTALVHFAMAMGIRTKIILPQRTGPWILGLDDTDHIAYLGGEISRRIDPAQGLEIFIENEMSTFIAQL